MSQQKPISKVLQEKTLPAKRLEQIKQVQSIRKFAQNKLKLPKNNSYTSYVDLKRDAISWNVIATPKYSIKPIKTCMPIAGCTSYLIYFSKARAKLEAKKHQKQGHDTYIIASPAYSTGGVFDDPIVSTMFRGGIASIAEVVFHELAHQRLYRRNDTGFNEAFASTIGEEGTKRWLREQHPNKVKYYNEYLQKKWLFFHLLITTRQQLDKAYKAAKTSKEKEAIKKNLLGQLTKKFYLLQKSWNGDKRFDKWFKETPINNAKLAVIGVYYQRVPKFRQQLKQMNYNFEKFYQYYERKKDIP